jgi:hypothetical protein
MHLEFVQEFFGRPGSGIRQSCAGELHLGFRPQCIRFVWFFFHRLFVDVFAYLCTAKVLQGFMGQLCPNLCVIYTVPVPHCKLKVLQNFKAKFSQHEMQQPQNHQKYRIYWF